MAKSHDTIATRLALILNKLNSGEHLSIEELADEFSVTTRTIQRDLNERLSFLPFKIENGFYGLEEYCLGKLNFQDMRTFATLSGIKELYPSLGDEFLVDLLNSKVSSAYLIRGFNQEDISSQADEFKIINVAILKKIKLKFIYTNKARVVNPYKLVSNSGSWYLLADDNGILKNFTLSKISDLCQSQKFFQSNKEFLKRIEENQTTWFSNTTTEVLLEIDKSIAYYFERKQLVPNQKIIEKQKDKYLISTTISYDEEILGTVRYWMPHIKIISPTNLQEKLENTLKAYLK